MHSLYRSSIAVVLGFILIGWIALPFAFSAEQVTVMKARGCG